MIFVFIGLAIASCSTSDDPINHDNSMACGISDPINELKWLNDEYKSIEKIPESGIILYMYNEKEVIEIQSSLMSSTNLSQYYCDGTNLDFDSPEGYKDYQDFRDNRTKIRILYGIDLWESWR